MSIRRLPVLRRYLLFQLPGIGIAIIVLAGLVEIWDMPVSAAALLLALWVAKDLALYPFVKVAYEPSSRGVNGPDALLGNIGIARDDLDPEGYVKVGSELWRARAVREEKISSGTRVRVVRVRDLTLVVEASDGDESGGSRIS